MLFTDLKLTQETDYAEGTEWDLSKQLTILAYYQRPTEEMGAVDLALISGRENLAQALLLRLLTPLGSLTGLGHTSYGSRLYELIGQPKTEATRNLCRAYILEVVRQESRVEEKAVALTFDPASETPSSFVFTLIVQPVKSNEAINLKLEVSL